MRSTNRAPASGERAVRFRWSDTSTGWPTCMPSRSPPAALVRITVRQPAAAATRTPVRDGVGAAALVQVGAAEQDEHLPAAEGERPDHPGVPGRGRRGEPRQVGHRQLGVHAAQRVGGRHPAGTEHHRDVVRGHPGPRGQYGGRVGGGRAFEIVGHGARP